MEDLLTGTAAGVPWVARPPHGGARPDAPAVVAWHLLDSPRTEAAFAAAVPLAGLDAWRIYFGLPLSGARLPAGGYEELQQRAMRDAVLDLHQRVAGGAVAEFPAALAAVRERLGIHDGPIGVLGGSTGGLAAQLAIAEGGADVRAAVLINPVVRLRDSIDGLAAFHGMSYTWTPPAAEFAERADFVARAIELADAAVLVITGEKDFEDAILRPVGVYVAELRRLGVTVDWQIIPGMGHAVADEPGVEPAHRLHTRCRWTGSPRRGSPAISRDPFGPASSAFSLRPPGPLHPPSPAPARDLGLAVAYKSRIRHETATTAPRSRMGRSDAGEGVG